MVGQSAAQLRLRETSIRDYDRPSARVGRSGRSCWFKSVTNEYGACDGVVLAAEENEAIVKGIPAGAMVCSEHAFLTDEELELVELITDADRARFYEGIAIGRGETALDLAHAQKLVDREDGKWGNG